MAGADADDAELLHRAARGEAAALLALYDRHGGLVLALAQRILGNRDEAEEVMQEAFVRAWQEAESYDPSRAGFRAWICTIARNRALDLLRRRATADRVATASADPAPEPVASPESDVADARERERVRAALAALPGPQRQALEMAFFEGLTHTEIAEKLATPLGTVKTRIFDGMRRLRALLDGGAS
ncbi:MAG TPA: sigma-70 family RNA polymerase sigma factor [bacterium]|nr:sigma-70 family RNA polymerase sigma factor [bacterium]